MNCLDFRRRYEAAPGEADDTMRAHAAACPACGEFMRRVQQVDRRIDAALRVPEPETLRDRILVRQSFRRSSPLRRWIPALAAVLVVAVALGVAAGSYLYDERRLENEVVALIEAADYALEPTSPVGDDRVADALAPLGLALAADPGPVSFAGRCLVRGNLSGHLVLRDGGEPVTVFLMPKERLLREARFEGGGWNGLLVPAGPGGSLAILGPPGTALEPVRERVLRSVRWQTG